MEATKATLEQAQKAPESQREQILKAITGEQLTGDLLTASIWGYFAAKASAPRHPENINHPGRSAHYK
ncbi:MAG: hypothetical protein J5746_13145 [Victivallales bacterium]|nr:hypothetical protein [Victivallales bacterium]